MSQSTPTIESRATTGKEYEEHAVTAGNPDGSDLRLSVTQSPERGEDSRTGRTDNEASRTDAGYRLYRRNVDAILDDSIVAATVSLVTITAIITGRMLASRKEPHKHS